MGDILAAKVRTWHPPAEDRAEAATDTSANTEASGPQQLTLLH